MNMASDNVVAGARTIIKRALHEADVRFDVSDSTTALINQARAVEAPVETMVGRWQMVAMGKPSLTDAQRRLLTAQAARAWYWFNYGTKDGL